MPSKVVLITGASGGIAQAIAPRLAARGDRLVLAGRRPDPLVQLANKVSAEFGTEVLAVPTDVAQFDQVETLVGKAQSQFGQIDCLLNCAGVGILKAAPQISVPDLDAMLEVNLKGSFYTSQLVCNVMRQQKSGHVLNFPGILGRYGMPMAAGYCASKFGVVGFSKCMADELKRFGVKFTLFFFGGVDSPFWDTVGMKVQRDKMLTTATVADAIMFALSVPSDSVPAEVVLQPESHQFL